MLIRFGNFGLSAGLSEPFLVSEPEPEVEPEKSPLLPTSFGDLGRSGWVAIQPARALAENEPKG